MSCYRGGSTGECAWKSELVMRRVRCAWSAELLRLAARVPRGGNSACGCPVGVNQEASVPKHTLT
jgi:hypothetical protein